jgi:spermidine synthase
LPLAGATFNKGARLAYTAGVRAAVLCAFFLSGASSLLFESLWTRELTLVFGSTTLAISTVLATFMGGLGLGSFLVGRRADRLGRPLRVYALVEGAIGAYALVVPLILLGYPELARALHRALGDHHVALSLGRFVASALLLGVPTTLMGATLPLLARHFIQQPWQMRRLGWRLGTLYATNTFGALSGAFLAGFVLLPSIGVDATNYTAAAINLLLCGGVLWIEARSRALGRSAAAAEQGPPLEALVDEAPPAPPPRRAVRVTLLAFVVSGAAAMMLEVLWTRALAVVLGSSVYSFSLILVAFLGGLAGGARLFARRAARTADPVRLLAFLHFGTVCAIALTYLVIDQLPRVFVWLLRGSSFDVDFILASQLLLATIVILPPTLLMGGVFPVTLRITTAALEEVGRDVGSAYALNTLGAIAGSFMAGFVVLPWAGLQRGIFLGGAMDAAMGAALLAVAPSVKRRLRLPLALALPAALLVVARLLPHWNLAQFDYGLFRVDYVREILAGGGRWSMPELVYYRDGMATTVSVERFGKHYALKNNGKVDASNGDDMPTQIMVGLMPFFFTPAPAPTVAVIGYGSGVTAGATTQTAAARIDVVELESAVVSASRYFEDVNHRPLADPRLHLTVGDGRNFLAQSRKRYDIIISEPSNPWITGVSNLFTREYWSLAHRRLTAGGVFCQWAQLYEMSPLHIKTILRTFAAEFPYTYVFAAEDLSSDVILVASDRPLRLDRNDLSRRLAEPRFRAEAHRAGVDAPEDLIAYLLLAPDEIPAFTAGAPVNTDDNALIEFGAPRDLLGYSRYDRYLVRVYGEDWPYGHIDRDLIGFSSGADYGRLAESLLAHGKVHQALHFIDRAGPLGTEARRLAELLANDPGLPTDLEPPRFPTTLPPAELERYAREYAQVERLARVGAFEEARKIIRKWPEEVGDQSGLDWSLQYAYICWRAERYDDALALLDAVEQDAAYQARRPAALYLLGRAYYAVASYAKGVQLLRRYLAVTSQPG